MEDVTRNSTYKLDFAPAVAAAAAAAAVRRDPEEVTSTPPTTTTPAPVTTKSGLKAKPLFNPADLVQPGSRNQEEPEIINLISDESSNEDNENSK